METDSLEGTTMKCSSAPSSGTDRQLTTTDSGRKVVAAGGAAYMDHLSYQSTESDVADTEECGMRPCVSSSRPSSGYLTPEGLDFEAWLRILPIAISVWDADPKTRKLLRPHLVLSSHILNRMWPMHSVSINDMHFKLPAMCKLFSRQPLLRSITISNCTLNDPLTCALSNLRLLQSLRLVRCPMKTPYFSTRLISLVHIRTLVINSCINMDTCVGSALAECSRLQHLEWYCERKEHHCVRLLSRLMELPLPNEIVAAGLNAVASGNHHTAAANDDNAIPQEAEDDGGIFQPLLSDDDTASSMSEDLPAGDLVGTPHAPNSQVVAHASHGQNGTLAENGASSSQVIAHASHGQNGTLAENGASSSQGDQETASHISQPGAASMSYGSIGSMMSDVSRIQPNSVQSMSMQSPANMSAFGRAASLFNMQPQSGLSPPAWTFLSGQHLTQLKLGYYEFGTHPDLESDCLSRLTSLQRICLTYCPGITPLTLLPLASLPHLQEIVLHGCLNLTADLFRHLVPLSHLTALRLQNCRLEASDISYVSALTQLRMLELSMCMGQPHLALQYICKLPELEILNLSDTDDVSNDGLQHLASLTRLTQLDLASCSGLDKESLYLIGIARSMQDLNLAYSSTLSVEGLQHLVLLHSTLHTLDISGFWPDDDTKGLQTFQIIAQLSSLCSLSVGFCFEAATPKAVAQLSLLGSLTQLDLSENFWVGSACLQQLEKLTGLRILDLSGCPSIEPEAIRHLTKLSGLEKLVLDFSLVQPEPYYAAQVDLSGLPVRVRS